MKTAASLIITCAILSGLLIGCRSAEQVYRDAVVGEVEVQVPANWVQVMENEEYFDEGFANWVKNMGPEYEVEMYARTDNAYIFILVTDMVLVMESMDSSWQGWDNYFEAMGMTSEEFAESSEWHSEVYTELRSETTKQLTIGGNEAWEFVYSSEYGGAPIYICTLTVFIPNNLALLVFQAKSYNWEQYEKVWEVIRDSVKAL